MNPIIIGIAGGSGSGKTSISNAVLERMIALDPNLLPAPICEKHVNGIDSNGTQGNFHKTSSLVTMITHDRYYKNWDGLSIEELEEKNFDHPDSLETKLLIEHLRRLKRGETVGIPTYDYKTHSRKEEVTMVSPSPIIFLDGILIFADTELRDLIDIKIFVDTDADIRFIRRLRRDTKERGRTAEYVATQYLTTVRPMHLQFVEPSKRYADIIIPEGGYDSHIAMEMVIGHLLHALRK